MAAQHLSPERQHELLWAILLGLIETSLRPREDGFHWTFMLGDEDVTADVSLGLSGMDLARIGVLGELTLTEKGRALL